MNLSDALEKLGQILDEERNHPTIAYEVSQAKSTNLGALAPLAFFTAQMERGKKHPRTVRSNPADHDFKSINYELLCAIWDQVRETDRVRVLALLRSRILNRSSYVNRFPGLGAGSWEHCSSELPLIAEFLVRRGNKQLLISSLAEAAISPGLTLLLLQLEEMIALNFTCFADMEYTQIPTAIGWLESAVVELKQKPKPADTIASNTLFYLVREIPVLHKSILEECRSARYLYVKGSLLKGINLEVNQDKSSVQGFLQKLGFPQLLIESLEAAENLYRTGATPFELKSCLGHLRSFVEQVAFGGV